MTAVGWSQPVAPAPASRPTEPAPSLADTLRSELTKMRTLRSAFWSFFGAVMCVLGLQLLVTILIAVNGPPNGHGLLDFFGYITGSWHLGDFAFMVLGVMAISTEYSTGLMVNTVLATPRRAQVMLAKVGAFTVVTLVVAEVMSFINFFIGHSILSAGHLNPNWGISGPDVLRAVIGDGIFATLVGLMGLGIGALVRNTAAGIVVGVAVLLILPVILSALPNSVSNPLLEYWPTMAGGRVTELTRDAHTLTAWWGAADMTAFVALLLWLGTWVVGRRDI